MKATSGSTRRWSPTIPRRSKTTEEIGKARADNAAYAATKYGLRGLHETLVSEYRGSGVRLHWRRMGGTCRAD